MRSWLLKFLLPILKLVGKIHAPYAKKLIKAHHYHYAKRYLKPGYVLLSRTYGELTNLVIPGELKHGAIFCGKNRITEALGVGVVINDLADFMFSKDEIVILRPLFCDDQDAVNAAQYALLQKGKPYDYEFKSSNQAFYCFELTYAAYREALSGESP